jgi:hypothetical protein
MYGQLIFTRMKKNHVKWKTVSPTNGSGELDIHMQNPEVAFGS